MDSDIKLNKRKSPIKVATGKRTARKYKFKQKAKTNQYWRRKSGLKSDSAVSDLLRKIKLINEVK